jgi:hypothetical protein
VKHRFYRRFVSARFTVGLLCTLALLLLLNVALPQAAVLGPARYAAVIERSGFWARFILETLSPAPRRACAPGRGWRRPTLARCPRIGAPAGW